MEEKTLLQQVDDLRKEVETLKNNSRVFDHQHNGFDSTKVNVADLNLVTCGNMYSNTSTTITVSSANVWYEITSNMSGGVMNNARIDGGHYIKIGSNGRYLIVWSLAMKTASANQELAGTIMVNNVANETVHGHSTVIASAKSSTASANAILNLTTRDEISLAVQNHTAGTNITVEHSQLSLLRIG